MVSNNNITIIIPSSTSYLDICHNFFEVLKLAWPECKYKVVLSLFGPPMVNDFTDDTLPETTIYSDKINNISGCVYEAAINNPSAMYLVFLPDAFMCNKVEDKEIHRLMGVLIQNNVEYCMLRPRRPYSKIKYLEDGVRYIAINDRYSHSFIAFAATPQFIEREFKQENNSDLDFELKYLNRHEEKVKYYSNHAIVTKNYFHILKTKKKGKWDRGALAVLKRHYPNVIFSDRERLDWKTEIALYARRILMKFIPDKVRIKIKKVYIKLMGKGPLVTND